MKAGYTILNGVMNYDKIVEVINHEKINQVVNLGWLITASPYKLRSHETVGVWKLKQLKN
jgi:hypothetical protein